MEDAISKVRGVHFFFSSITGTFNSSKCKKSETQKKQVEMRNAEDWKDDVWSDVETEPEALPFYPRVAYFVAFTPSDTCNAETILRTLHEQETEVDVCQLRTNLKPLSDETYDEASEKLLRELYLVVKDHNNNAVQEMTARSNQFCLAKKCTILLMTGMKNNSDKHLVVIYLYLFK